MALTRRSLGVLAVAGAVVIGTPKLLRLAAPLPETRPMRDLPGFEVVRSGPLTSNSPALAGIDRRDAPPDQEIAAIRANPAATLFDAPQPGRVPLAVFTDVNCPNCRQISATLAAWIHDDSQPIHVTWHELPLLGPTSLTAARAALAAGMQGAYLSVHEQMMQSRFRPSPAYIRDLAATAGIDADQMFEDMPSPEVDRQLARSKALAYVFGIPGTPAMVIKNTLVIGALSETHLRRMIRQAV